MGGRLNLDGGTLNLDGKTLKLDEGARPPRPPYNFSTGPKYTDEEYKTKVDSETVVLGC